MKELELQKEWDMNSQPGKGVAFCTRISKTEPLSAKSKLDSKYPLFE